MIVNVPKLGKPNLYGYQYDQLNRIVRIDAFTGLNPETSNFTTAPLKMEDYHEEISYDPSTLEKKILLRSMSVPIDISGKSLRSGVKQKTGL